MCCVSVLSLATNCCLLVDLAWLSAPARLWERREQVLLPIRNKYLMKESNKLQPITFSTNNKQSELACWNLLGERSS